MPPSIFAGQMGCERAMTEKIVAGGFIVDLMHGPKAP